MHLTRFRAVATVTAAIASVAIMASAAMGAVTYKSSTSAANGQSNAAQKTISVSKPTGASGDLFVAQIAVRNTDDGANWTAPAGWTQVSRITNGTFQQRVYYKVRAASDGSNFTWSWTSGADATGIILAYTGYDATTPVDSGAHSAGNTTSPFLSNTLAAVPDGARLVGFLTIAQNNSLSINSSVSPSGSTERKNQTTQSAQATRVTSAAADVGQSGTGPSTAFTWTTSTNNVQNSIAQQIAVLPGSAGGGTGGGGSGGGSGSGGSSGGSTSGGANGSGTKAGDTGRPRPRITICHATSSATNPYVVITVDPNSIFTQGHDQHQDGRDIIPAFSYTENGVEKSYPGKNLNAEGLALLQSGCRAQKAASKTSGSATNLVPTPPKKPRITICHATSSATNPYVRITVAPEAIYTQGHDQHQDGRDIIPPFSYVNNQGATITYLGKNWDSESQAILNNGCKQPKPFTGPITPSSKNVKVTLCHREGGPQYVRITIAWQAALNGHDAQHAKDIIPPFEYVEGGATKQFPGKNWDATGQAIFEAGCIVPPNPPTPIPDDPITPTVNCINTNADGTFNVVFGYNNPNGKSIAVASGPDNNVAFENAEDAASASALVTTFGPGVNNVAFTATNVGADGTATWSITVGGVTKTVTASIASPACTAPPAVPAVSVQVECVTNNGDGTYSATFGYLSQETSAVSLPVGASNSVTLSGAPTPIDRGQPTSFAPGSTSSAFTVTGIPLAQSVTWSILSGADTRTATATSDSTSCATKNDPQITAALPIGVYASCVQPNTDGTYDAVFGYENPNDGLIEIAAGDMNSIVLSPGDPGGQSRGQTVVFFPGSDDTAFTVTSIPSSQAVTWTIAYQGTSTASANVDLLPRCLKNRLSGGVTDPGPTPPALPPTPENLQLGTFLTCVTPAKGGRTYNATFGYDNPGSQAFSVAVGSNNSVSGGASADRGQPSQFAPGTTSAAFTVYAVPSSQSPKWTVKLPNGQVATATANANAPRCTVANETPQPGLTATITAPRKRVVGTKVTSVVTVRNNGQKPVFRPVIDIPTPKRTSKPSKIVAPKGVVCRRVSAALTRCTATTSLLAGRSFTIRLTGTALKPGPAMPDVVAAGRSSSGQRLTAVDSTPSLYVSATPPVTG